MNRPSYKELWLYERKDRDEQLQWIRDAVVGNAKFRNNEPPYSEEEELARQVMTMHTRCAELKAAQRWIPVSERLPEENQQILSTDGKEFYLDYYARWEGKDNPPCFCDGLSWAVTHWMPLPKPPEVEE